MAQPIPPNNPVYRTSVFPNAVDSLTDANAEEADAIMAVQATLIGSVGAPPLASMGATSVKLGGASSLFSGTGAPATGLGAVGDYYFRTDTPSTANQRIYVKTAAAVWTGIV
jgi:hypothetical protein